MELGLKVHSNVYCEIFNRLKLNLRNKLLLYNNDFSLL